MSPRRKATIEETWPEAVVVKVIYHRRLTGLVSIVHVRCPICGHKHAHGGPTEGRWRRSLGGRARHCGDLAPVNAAPGYVIVDPQRLTATAGRPR